MTYKMMMTRRGLLRAGLAGGCLVMAGCSQPSPEQSAANSATGGGRGNPAQAGGAAPRAQQVAMLVHRDPNCGCCESWAALARRQGYVVTVQNEADMAAVKGRLGVPAQLASCHTTVVGDYVFEGHVPFEEVARLLAERPDNIRGLAVPGMPAGSPGMEVPDGTVQPFEVIAFDRTGSTSVYARYPAQEQS